MKVIYTFEIFNIDEQNKYSCEFCEINKSVGHIRTRNAETNKLLGSDYACENCRGNIIDKKQFEACLKCGRLVKGDESDEECMCEFLKEKYGDDEKEVIEPTKSANLEKQINELSLEKEQLAEDVEIAISALGVAEQWDSRKELIEENKELAEKRRRLSNENKKLKEKVLLLESELNAYKVENSDLKEQVNNLKSGVLELEAKIEQPPK